MNIAHEFFKVRDAFRKVKTDMDFISDKISQNYDEFLNEHKKLSEEVSYLSNELKTNLEKVKEIHLTNPIEINNPQKEKDFYSLKEEIKLLKKDVLEIQTKHTDVHESINSIKKNKKEIKDLKEKLHSSELEIFLLKDKIAEKDVEIKQVKEISKHLYEIVDELSKAELDMLNMQENSPQKV